MRDFLIGISFVPRGFKLLWAPGLRRFVVFPIVINLVVFGLLIWLGVHQFALLVEWLLPDPTQWDGDGWLETIMQYLVLAVRWLLWPVFVLSAMVIMFYSFTLIANLLGAPFNSPLAARVEQTARGSYPSAAPQRSLIAEVVHSIGAELRKYLYFARLVIPLLVLFFIPGINLLAPFLWAIAAAWMIAVEYGDYPMGGHGLKLARQRETLRQRRMLALGFGFGVMTMTLIPGLNLLAMPTAVIGATLLWVEHWAGEAQLSDQSAGRIST